MASINGRAELSMHFCTSCKARSRLLAGFFKSLHKALSSLGTQSMSQFSGALYFPTIAFILFSRGFLVNKSLTRVAKSSFTFGSRLVDSSKIEAPFCQNHSGYTVGTRIREAWFRVVCCVVNDSNERRVSSTLRRWQREVSFSRAFSAWTRFDLRNFCTSILGLHGTERLTQLMEAESVKLMIERFDLNLEAQSLSLHHLLFKCKCHKIPYLLIRKGFQNEEEWRFILFW